MNRTAQKLNDKWFRFIGVPVIGLMGHIIFFNRNETGSERFGFLTIYLLSIAETVVLWEVNRAVVLHYRKAFSGLEQTTKRIIYTLIVCTVLTIVLRILNIFIYDKSLLWGYRFPLEAYLHSVFVAILFVVIIAGIYEAVYYFTMWKNTAVEAEALRAENLQTELDLLKVQLNPHFLFNTFGSLSSLIDEDPARAKIFLEQMSVVYRYILQSHDKPLITLKEELEFISSYARLLKTRFENGLQLEFKITRKEYYDYSLPVLTIQLLVENAVKHNIIIPDKPLVVTVYTDDDANLIVENNLQKKMNVRFSNKKGLLNIITKYKILANQDVKIEETGGYFRVSVPLIKTR